MKNRKILKVVLILAILIVVCLVLIFAIPRKIIFYEANAKYIGATRIIKSLENSNSEANVKRESTDYNIYEETAIKDILQLLASISYRPSITYNNLSAEKEKLELDIYASYDVEILSISIFPDSSYIKINGNTFKNIEGNSLKTYQKLIDALEKYNVP